jgi:hypothetical protein
VTGRAVTVPVHPVVARQESIERRHEILVRARTDLDDDEPGGRMRDEDREQPVRLGRDEAVARRGQVEQAARGARPDGELERPYGKMLRSASRIRPSPPPTGVDS